MSWPQGSPEPFVAIMDVVVAMSCLMTSICLMQSCLWRLLASTSSLLASSSTTPPWTSPGPSTLPASSPASAAVPSQLMARMAMQMGMQTAMPQFWQSRVWPQLRSKFTSPRSTPFHSTSAFAAMKACAILKLGGLKQSYWPDGCITFFHSALCLRPLIRYFMLQSIVQKYSSTGIIDGHVSLTCCVF